MAIYHMIRDDADFLPVDHEEAVTRNTLTNKGLNLTNIIAFLGEHGPSRKKNPSKSCQTEQNDSFGVPVPTAATA